MNPYAIAIFCEAWVGLAAAYAVKGHEPLPVVKAISRRTHMWRPIGRMLGIALIAVVPALLIGSIGLEIGRQLLGEINRTDTAMSMLPTGAGQAFFLLLSSAGIAEETTYRLVYLSLIWRWTGKRLFAIVFAAVLFGVYHLTPLDSMYQVFWQFPFSQFLASTLIGMVWGYIYTKFGYETAVLGHTLSDWIPVFIGSFVF